MPFLDGDVVGYCRAVGLDLVEDGGLQAGLVALDGQEVVGAALAGDVVGGVVLRMVRRRSPRHLSDRAG